MGVALRSTDPLAAPRPGAGLRDLRIAHHDGTRRAPAAHAGRLLRARGVLRGAAAPVMVNGKKLRLLDGYASVTGIEYEMYDMFGIYYETVAPEAFDQTLAAHPDVAFLVNHKGLTMARTVARQGEDPTLLLDADPRGLHSAAYVNP